MKKGGALRIDRINKFFKSIHLVKQNRHENSKQIQIYELPQVQIIVIVIKYFPTEKNHQFIIREKENRNQ